MLDTLFIFLFNTYISWYKVNTPVQRRDVIRLEVLPLENRLSFFVRVVLSHIASVGTNFSHSATPLQSVIDSNG